MIGVSGWSLMSSPDVWSLLTRIHVHGGLFGRQVAVAADIAVEASAGVWFLLRQPVVQVFAGSLLRGRRAEAVGCRRSLAGLPAAVQRHGLGVIVAQRLRGLDEVVGVAVAFGTAEGLSHASTDIRGPSGQTLRMPGNVRRSAYGGQHGPPDLRVGERVRRDLHVPGTAQALPG